MSASTVALAPETERALWLLCQSAAGVISQEWSQLMNRSIALEAQPPRLIQERVVPARFHSSPCVVTEAAVEGGLTGETHYLLSFADAVTLSGLMLMLRDPIIQKKRTLQQTVDLDEDAYKEAMNILCGASARGFKKNLGIDLSVIQRATKTVDFRNRRVDLDLFLPQAPWIISYLGLKIDGFPDGTMLQILPLASCRPLFQMLQLPDPAEQTGRSLLYLTGDEASAAQLREALAGQPYRIETIPEGDTDKVPQNLNGSILCIDVSAEEAIQTCGTLIRRGGLVLACCSPDVGKELLMQVVRTGVKGVLLKPFKQKAVIEKLSGL
jgi:hypothetical protein